MIFEDMPFVGLDFLLPPLDALVHPPEETGNVTSIEYTQTGFVVVGSQYANNGQMMMVSDAQGRAQGVAFGDGDGNWDNEWEALGSGLACAGGLYVTGVSAGMLSVVTGAGTAYACFDFLRDFGTLLTEYNGNTNDYTQRTVWNFGSHPDEWDIEYIYTYANGGSWTIQYDADTQTYGPWVWKTGTLD